ncbi:Rho GTPase-activating protein syd-1 [Folsomia candida]|uniref:Rho GTPase-activating protein syd-1 n=1 Tax=Folsomia candida TaxID=158441 RepID=A0A226DDC2_FOLCA|nr:Rho GTPase-activating protein syd-1 [Folsomia candida]
MVGAAWEDPHQPNVVPSAGKSVLRVARVDGEKCVLRHGSEEQLNGRKKKKKRRKSGRKETSHKKEETRRRRSFASRGSMLCCGRRKDQGRDIPPNADQPAASPRRLQLGQFATTIPPGRGGVQQQQQQLPHMVSGISTEIFRQLESVENDHDATTAAALGAVERRGEMLDGLHSVQFVEIGNGVDRYDGVFVSRIAIESAVFNSGCLGVGDEILAVNLVDVTHMSLDDVVILMSIPRRLVLTIRQRKGKYATSN